MNTKQKVLKVKLNRRIDILLSLYPSFASTLFEVEHSDNGIIITKLIGQYSGTRIVLTQDTAVCEGMCERKLLEEWLGLWFNPRLYVGEIPKNIRLLVLELVESYEGLTLITSSIDWKIILAATFLSRRTDYHTNVVRWIRKIFTNIELDDIRKVKNRIADAGKSYQLKQLAEILDELYTISFNKDPWSLRRDLLEIRYVGPKTVDAFLLFSGKGSMFTPSDVHYTRFAERVLGFKDYVVPSKTMCLAHDGNCLRCPYASKCLTGRSIRIFGKLSGWIQTIAYVHDKLFCMRNKCNVCMFKSMCSFKTTISSP